MLLQPQKLQWLRLFQSQKRVLQSQVLQKYHDVINVSFQLMQAQ